ncbi:hypothetical protein BDN72DRAFT_863561 [Pluteus cervinus]|uniref:Uncharacterized protein n=1 Tax=Pluteus cervinus TaxID=181527 RepID=A0ACD3A7X0_9AGAR|nr:hypothetical protein BDN72DRAFT_863561 [Pluteus cervinus]
MAKHHGLSAGALGGSNCNLCDLPLLGGGVYCAESRSSKLSNPQPSTTVMMDANSEPPQLRHFNIKAFEFAARNIKSILDYSEEEKHTAARAINRSGLFRDGQHLTTRTEHGLHPAYFQFRMQAGSALHSPTFLHNPADWQDCMAKLHDDLLDVATILDRVDGGVTVIMRVPGSKVTEHTDAADITIDSYITPITLGTGGAHMERTIAGLFQQFGEEIALPHLHLYNGRCAIEHLIADDIPLPGPRMQPEQPHLPDPVSEGSAFIRCRLRDRQPDYAMGAFVGSYMNHPRPTTSESGSTPRALSPSPSPTPLVASFPETQPLPPATNTHTAEEGVAPASENGKQTICVEVQSGDEKFSVLVREDDYDKTGNNQPTRTIIVFKVRVTPSFGIRLTYHYS